MTTRLLRLAELPADVMLAGASDAVPGPSSLPGGCQYEPKFDGYRGLLQVGADAIRVLSRRGADLTRSFPDVTDAAQPLPAGTVLDGELVVWAGQSLEFGELQRRVAAPGRARQLAAARPATLVVFDVLAVAGQDVRKEPLSARRERLEQLLAPLRPPLELIPASCDVGLARQWMAEWAQARVGIEGLVVKGLAQAYLPGRRDWVKVRIRETTEVLVGAVVGPLERPDRLVLGLPDGEGGLIVAGGTSGLSDRDRSDLAGHLRRPQGDHPWPTQLPQGRMGRFGGGTVEVTLVEPDVVAEIAADLAFEHGKWRHLTRFVRVRQDMTAGDVSLRSAPPAEQH